MKITRRKFLTISAGAIAMTAASEMELLGFDAASIRASAQKVPMKRGREIPSLCPYCAVGCGQIVTVDDSGNIIDIQGNPDSPINDGTLCPKGAATYQLVANPLRWTKVRYRAPGSDHWEEKSLDWAMNRIAVLVSKTRNAHFNVEEQIRDEQGRSVKKRVMNTYALASLGGATIANEWNYIHQKLMHGLGVVYLENQARI